jgi:hypothetical protein
MFDRALRDYTPPQKGVDKPLGASSQRQPDWTFMTSARARHRSWSIQNSALIWVTFDFWQVKNIFHCRPHRCRLSTLRMPQKESRCSVATDPVGPPFEPGEAMDTLKSVFHRGEVYALGRKDDHLIWCMLPDEMQKPRFSDADLFRRASVKAFIPTANTIRNVVRHPPQSGWLDEWGRLKGGHPLV